MRTLPNMIRNEALRKPAVAALLARVHDLTDEEIDTAEVPMKWYRDALRMIRAEKAVADLTAVVERNTVSMRSKDHTGTVLRFAGIGEDWVKFGNLDWMVREGDLVFVTDRGHGWYGQSWFKSLAQRSRFEVVESGVGHARYYELYQAHMAAMYFDAPVIDLTGQAKQAPTSAARSRMASLGVRIG